MHSTVWRSHLYPGWRLVTKFHTSAVEDQNEQGAVRGHDSTGMNWGQKERLSPALILPGLAGLAQCGLPRFYLPSNNCKTAEKFPLCKMGKRGKESNSESARRRESLARGRLKG